MAKNTKNLAVGALGQRCNFYEGLVAQLDDEDKEHIVEESATSVTFLQLEVNEF